MNFAGQKYAYISKKKKEKTKVLINEKANLEPLMDLIEEEKERDIDYIEEVNQNQVKDVTSEEKIYLELRRDPLPHLVQCAHHSDVVGLTPLGKGHRCVEPEIGIKLSIWNNRKFDGEMHAPFTTDTDILAFVYTLCGIVSLIFHSSQGPMD